MTLLAVRSDQSIQIVDQPVDQCRCLVGLDMKSIVGHLSGLIDNHGPGVPPER